MEKTTIIEKSSPKMHNPVLITGLPGIGLVGQVVCKYLIEKLNAKKFADLYSPYFPHQVFMTKKGAIRPIKNRFYHARAGKQDLIILVGDVQALTSEGQYEVAGRILEFAERHGVKRVYTIGGYSTGKVGENSKVFAVTTHKDMVKELQAVGVVFGEAKGAIVGAAGLLPMLSKLHGMKGVCMMGSTHGSYVDATSARNVINTLEKLLGFNIDLSDLEKQAKEGEKIIKKIEEEVQKQMVEPYNPDTKNVSYIR